MMDAFTRITEVMVKPEDADRFRELSGAAACASSGASGCLRYDVLERHGKPGIFVICEVYRNEAAFKAHTAHPLTQYYLQAVEPILLSQCSTQSTTKVSLVPWEADANAAVVAQMLRRLNTSLISDALRDHAPERLVMRGVSALRPPHQMLAGRARTLRFLPARSDVKPAGDYRRALIDSVRGGEVLVFEAASTPDFPVFGDMTALRATQNGAAGCVTDGFVRDVESINEIGLPVFARGTWPSPSASFPIAWEMDEPIQCGGVLVMPGDWIIGDADGVMVIPPALVALILEKAPPMLKKEEFSRQLLLRGHSLAECYPLASHLYPHFERWVSDGTLPKAEEVTKM